MGMPLDEGPNDTQFHQCKREVSPPHKLDIEGNSFICVSQNCYENMCLNR